MTAGMQATAWRPGPRLTAEEQQAASLPCSAKGACPELPPCGWCCSCVSPGSGRGLGLRDAGTGSHVGKPNDLGRRTPHVSLPRPAFPEGWHGMWCSLAYRSQDTAFRSVCFSQRTRSDTPRVGATLSADGLRESRQPQALTLGESRQYPKSTVGARSQEE